MTYLQIPVDHAAFTGHFPGNPVLPGVTILEYVVRAYPGQTKGFKVVKFLKPVRPGVALRIEFGAQKTNSQTFCVTSGGAVVCEGMILLEYSDV